MGTSQAGHGGVQEVTATKAGCQTQRGSVPPLPPSAPSSSWGRAQSKGGRNSAAATARPGGDRHIVPGTGIAETARAGLWGWVGGLGSHSHPVPTARDLLGSSYIL